MIFLFPRKLKLRHRTNFEVERFLPKVISPFSTASFILLHLEKSKRDLVPLHPTLEVDNTQRRISFKHLRLPVRCCKSLNSELNSRPKYGKNSNITTDVKKDRNFEFTSGEDSLCKIQVTHVSKLIQATAVKRKWELLSFNLI